MARLSVVVLVAGIVLPHATAAQQENPNHTAASSDAELLAVREAAWHDFFGNTDALAPVLPNDFIAISPSGGALKTRADALNDSREFIANGGKLVSVEFPTTRIQRYGDVAIVYSEFRLVLEVNGEKQAPFAGRATEVFLWRDGRWVHPGWHLDDGT